VDVRACEEVRRGEEFREGAARDGNLELLVPRESVGLGLEDVVVEVLLEGGIIGEGVEGGLFGHFGGYWCDVSRCSRR